MQLRNGKITNANKKDTLVGEIKKRQNMVDRVSAGETPSRVAVIREVFNVILDNIDYRGVPKLSSIRTYFGI